MWFRVDDNLAFHPKAMRAANPALGLWVRAGSWAGQQLTDGFVPEDVARAIGPRVEIERLVRAGLWVPSDGGFEFHDFTDYNPTRESVQQKRKATAERIRRWRENRDKPDGEPNG